MKGNRTLRNQFGLAGKVSLKWEAAAFNRSPFASPFGLQVELQVEAALVAQREHGPWQNLPWAMWKGERRSDGLELSSGEERTKPSGCSFGLLLRLPQNIFSNQATSAEIKPS